MSEPILLDYDAAVTVLMSASMNVRNGEWIYGDAWASLNELAAVLEARGVRLAQVPIA